jgi:hypothetical protein
LESLNLWLPPAGHVPHPERVVRFSRSFHAYGHSFTQAEERGARGDAARDTTKKPSIVALPPLAILGLSWSPDNVALAWIMNILTIASAVVVALLPIIFFAFTPTLPEIER